MGIHNANSLVSFVTSKCFKSLIFITSGPRLDKIVGFQKFQGPRRDSNPRYYPLTISPILRNKLAHQRPRGRAPKIGAKTAATASVCTKIALGSIFDLLIIPRSQPPARELSPELALAPAERTNKTPLARSGIYLHCAAALSNRKSRVNIYLTRASCELFVHGEVGAIGYGVERACA